MGHVANASAIPVQWRHWDAVGRSVAQRKEKIRRRLAAIEMTSTSTEVSGLDTILEGTMDKYQWWSDRAEDSSFDFS